MECSFIRENLFPIAENKLSEEEMARVKEHIETCRECVSHIAFFNNLEQSVQAMKRCEPAPFISTRTIAMLENRFPADDTTGRLTTRLILQPAVLAFFMGLAIFAGILFGTYGFRQHDEASIASDTEALKTELVIHELASEETGLLLLQ